MCGRFTLTDSAMTVARRFGVPQVEPYPPRYNIAPAQPILIVIGGSEERVEAARPGRSACLARWGLIPAWAREPAGLPLLFNARSESAATRNAFRAALTYRRCLIPASGFYEWKKTAKGRSRPYFLRPRGEGPIAFAGLTETWLASDGSEIDTATILTTAAGPAMAEIHERMPVVIDVEDQARWLNCREFGPPDVADLHTSNRDAFFEIIPVSEKINSADNFSPEVQERVERQDDDDRPEDTQGSFGF